MRSMHHRGLGAASQETGVDLNGVWEINYKYDGIEADVGVSYQAFIIVQSDRFVGYDALGTKWSGTFFSDSDGLAVRLHIDTDGAVAEAAILVGPGEVSRTASSTEMIVRISLVGEGNGLAALGSWQDGAASVKASLRRRIMFDGPGF